MDGWETDLNERKPTVRVGKTWRLDWDIALIRWLRRLVERKRKWKS